MRSITIEIEPWRSQGDRGISVRVVSHAGRWVRAAVSYGVPPGSRIGFWRTRSRSGNMRGVNLRIGRRIAGPCLTLSAYRGQRTVTR